MNLYGVVFLCIATIAWGGMFPAAKIALASLDPITITSVRYLAVTFFLAPLVHFANGQTKWGWSGIAGAVLGGVIGIAGFNVLMLYGLQHTTPERAAVVMALLPLTTGILSWIVGEGRLSLADIASLVVASLGVALLVSHGNWLAFDPGPRGGGDFWVVTGMVCWAGYTLITERVRGLTAAQYTFVATAAGSGVLTLYLIISWSLGLQQVPGFTAIQEATWPLAYMVSIGGVVAILAWSQGVRLVGSLNAALFINLIPITAFVIGVFQGHSILDTDLLGGALVIASLITHNYSRRSNLALAQPDGGSNALRKYQDNQ